MARPRSDIALRIVTAAAERFLHDGVDGASLRQIAVAAGTNLGMVYYYFPTKDDLFLAVVERHYAPLSQAIIEAIAAGPSFDERVRALYDRFGAMSDEEFVVLRLMLREALVSSERLNRVFERMMQGHTPAMLELLSEGIATGRVAADLHPVAALVTMAVLAIAPQVMVRRVAASVKAGTGEARARGLRWLVALYGFDVEHGCAGVVDALGRTAVAAALEVATAGERRALARRVRGAMARGDEWARYAWGAVLVELEEGLADDEEGWMELARAHHRPAARCRRLLALGRVAEAWTAFSEVADVELLTLTGRFEERGLGAEFTEAVKARAARAGAAGRERLVAWLRGREERADEQAALGLAEGVLAADPTRAALDELRQRAEALGRWGEVRERAEAVLDAKAPAVLVAWLLEAGDLAAARRVAEDERARPAGFGASRVAVAEALEEGDPEGAARVYLRQAEACVAQRGRASYREACAMLARVERVLSARGREAEARALREGFAARHARLSSLRAELVQHFGPLAA